MKIEDYPDRDLLALDLADRLASELGTALRNEDRVTFAVPGGTTPGPIFDALSAVRLDWDRVDVVLTDERWVADTSDRSNTRLLKERLLTGRSAAATLLPLRLDAGEPESAIERLCEGLKPHLPIDVLVLGMGTDMHTASLFPGAEGLSAALAADAPEVVAIRAPGAPEPRVTLSARVLNGALSKHLVIFGAEKREALLRAQDQYPEDAPVSAVLDGMTVHWAE